MIKQSAVVLAISAFFISPATAQKEVKVGFVVTFSGPTAVMGNQMRDAFELALDHLDRKLGGLKATIIYEDDQQKPDVGKQRTDKLIEADKVNFLTGYLWSNTLLASLKSANDSETFIISAVAGPSQIAGEQCSPWFFSTSWQGDQIPQAVGEYLNRQEVKTVYLMAPNYAAGKDILAGFKSAFKGTIAGESYTKWPDQLDFSAELSTARASKSDAIFAFYPGAAGVQFITQYAQSGLKERMPLYTAHTIDALSLPLLKDLALGASGAQQWGVDFTNESNKKFVSGFREKYKRDPAPYAAQAYDAAFLIDAAVKAAGGDLSKKDLMRDAMRKADFNSVRGPYKYGNNHFPIQNFYLQEAVKDADGSYTFKTLGIALKDHQDRYADRCKMKW